MSRNAADIDLAAENLGTELKKEMGTEAGAVKVKDMVKGWNAMAAKGFVVSKQVTEGRVVRMGKRGAGGSPTGSPGVKKEASASAAAVGADDDMDLDDMDLDDMDLDLDVDMDDEDDDAAGAGGAAGADEDEDLGDLDDLDLDDLGMDDLDDDDEAAAAKEGANAGGDGDDDDMDLDDMDLDDMDVDLDDAGDDAVKASNVTSTQTKSTGAAHSDLEGLQGAMAHGGKDDDGGKKAPAPAALPKLNFGALPKPESTHGAGDDKKEGGGEGGGEGDKPIDNVVTLRIDSHLLASNKFLKEPFKVVKIDEGAIVGGRKDRIWEIDFFQHNFNNLDSNGYKSFSMPGSKLFRVERHQTDPKRLTVYFFEAAHPYDLQFTSVDRRNRFFELSMLQRRAAVMWCPSLCPDGENDARIQINGTNIKRHSGKIAKVQGKGTFMIARMPYEIHEVWFGVINLRGQPLPANPSVLNSMMPRGSEVYVLGVLETPTDLLGQKTLGDFILAHLGTQSYYVLAQSVIESKPKSCNSNTVILTIVRRPFIIHLSNIEGVELDSVVTDSSGSPTGYTMAACTLRIHESLCAFIVVQAVGTAKLSDSQRASHFRLALSNLNIGNEKLDIGSRFDYCFIAGAPGFPKPFSLEKTGEGQDALIAQMNAGNMLSDFKEAPPSADLKAAQYPMRILYKSRAGSCRADVKTYSSIQKNMPFGNNTFMTVDLFVVRTFLSSFGETAKPINIHLKDIIIVPERIPAFGDAELVISGTWFEPSPPIPIERTGEHYSVKNENVPILRPSVFNKEFVRLQSMDFAVFGVLDAAREKKKAAKKVMLACGTLSLKNNSAIGETKDFTVPLIFRACTVGSIIASISLPFEHQPPEHVEEAASPTKK